MAALFLLLSIPACASHFATLSSRTGGDDLLQLREACAEVARQFEMHDRAYPGMSDEPDESGWYAVAFYEHSRHPECEHERIYLLADANPESGHAQFKINNFSSGTETDCARLIREALRQQLDAAGLSDIEVQHKRVHAIGP